MEMIDQWKDILFSPVEAFSKYLKKASYSDAAKHLIIAGLIAGFFSGLMVSVLGYSVAGVFGMTGASAGILGFLYTLIMTPISYLITWILGAAVLYIFAILLKGKGDFLTHSYALALLMAPLNVVMTILGIIPIVNMLNIVVFLYGLYVLTISLRTAHKYTTANAIMTWLIPVIILILLVLFVVGTAILSTVGVTLPKLL